MTFWVDADSCPKQLRPIILKAAVRKGAAAFFVADRELKDVVQFISDDTHRLRSQKGDSSLKSLIKMVVVSTGQDSADNWIVQNADSDGICITHDIPLASRLLEKGCIVIDDRGGSYNKENIRSLLGDRAVNATLREYGVFAFQQAKNSTQASVKAFSDNLDRTITRFFTTGNADI